MEDTVENGVSQDDGMSLFEGMDFVGPLTFEVPDDDKGGEGQGGGESPALSVSGISLKSSEGLKSPNGGNTPDAPDESGQNNLGNDKSLEFASSGPAPAGPQSPVPELAKSFSSGTGVLSGPLDESMFSGLSVSSEDPPLDQSAAVDVAEEGSLKEDIDDSKIQLLLKGESSGLSGLPFPRNLSEQSMDSRVSEDSQPVKESVPGATIKQPTHLPSSNGGAPGATTVRSQVVRKKKRTLKVGYARDAEEGDEVSESQAATSAGSSGSTALNLAALYGTGDVPAGSETLTEGGLQSGSGEVSTVHLSKSRERTPETAEQGAVIESDDSKRIHARLENPSETAEAGRSEVPGTSQDERLNSGVSKPDDSGTEARLGTEKDEAPAQASNDGAPGGSDHAGQVAPKELLHDHAASSTDQRESADNAEKPSESQSDSEDILNPEILKSLPLLDRPKAIKRGVKTKLAALKAKVGTLVVQRQLAVQKRRKATQVLSAASAKVKELESRVAEACEQEDFEAADLLSQQAEEAERDESDARVQAREAEEECNLAVSSVQEAEEVGVEVELEAARLLKAIEEEASLEAQKVKEKALAEAMAELEKLADEEESMETRRRKVVLEQRVVEEEAAELKKKVEESTKLERAEKYEMVAERTKMEEALEELRRQVAVKEAEINAQDEKISAVEKKIAVASAKFEKARAGLEAEGERVRSALKEIDAEVLKMEEEKRRVEEARESAEVKGRQLEESADVARREAMDMESSAEGRKAAAGQAAALRDKMGQLAAREKAVGEETQGLRELTLELKSALQELGAARTKLQQDSAAAHQRVALAEKRGPELEAEKRLAAGSRNFKEAARLAAEAKLLANDKEAALTEIATLHMELAKVEKDEVGKAAELEELDLALGRSQVEVAMARCERLRLVAMVARKEMEAAAEVEEFEEAEGLSLESEAADEEADELQQVHRLEGKEYERIGGGVESGGRGVGEDGDEGEREGEGKGGGVGDLNK